MKNDVQILGAAIAKFGVDSQVAKTLEECGELIVAIMHHRDNRIDVAALASEVADVSIMVQQMEMMLPAGLVAEARREKLDRLRKRLEVCDDNLP